MNELVHVKGLKELNDFLQQLPAKMERNVMRGALRAGAKPILEAAKAAVPVKTGTLRDGLKVKTSARGGKVIASVRTTGKHAYLARWMEYGVAAHAITAKAGGWMFFGGKFARSTQHPGLAARPFMRPALDNQATAAVVAAGNYIKSRLATKHGLDTSDVEVEAAE